MGVPDRPCARVIRQGALDADIVAQSREGTITVEPLEMLGA